jgi:hypothetical protein
MRFTEGVLEGHRYINVLTETYREWTPELIRPTNWYYTNPLIRPNTKNAKGFLDTHSWRFLHNVTIYASILYFGLFVINLPEKTKLWIPMILLFVPWVIGNFLYELSYSKVYYSKWIVDRTKIDASWYIFNKYITWIRITPFINFLFSISALILGIFLLYFI